MFRELIDQAIKEKRVVLTRDAKLLRHEYLLRNQIYRVKSLLKNDQLIEVLLLVYIIRYPTNYKVKLKCGCFAGD